MRGISVLLTTTNPQVLRLYMAFQTGLCNYCKSPSTVTQAITSDHVMVSSKELLLFYYFNCIEFFFRFGNTQWCNYDKNAPNM